MNPFSIFFAVAAAAGMAFASGAESPRPIIGIYAQPHSSSLCPNGESCQYIAASYVKFVESHGARAVPIPYDTDNATIDHLFESINGVLFPGGGAAVPMGAYRMFDNAVSANSQGDYFPLWGTCMGFQWLLQLAGARCAASSPRAAQFVVSAHLKPLYPQPRRRLRQRERVPASGYDRRGAGLGHLQRHGPRPVRHAAGPGLDFGIQQPR